jgi:hypothetical protein
MEKNRTITHREYLDMCANVVASSKANPYGETRPKVQSCIEYINVLLDELGYKVID